MAITINGDGSITGLSVGGLPDGSVDSDTLASGIDKTSITDSGDATAITIDSSEKVNFNQGRLQLGHINKFIDTANYVGDAINIGSHPYANGTVIGQSYPADSPTTIKRTIHTTGTETKFFTVSGATETERVRIDQHGIKFNGDTAAANALDDYEEGTWTPTISATSSSPTVTYNNQYGWYLKIGSLVHIGMWIEIGSISGGSGDVFVTLPFTSSAHNYGVGGWSPNRMGNDQSLSGTRTDLSFSLGGSTNQMRLTQSGGSNSNTQWTNGVSTSQISGNSEFAGIMTMTLI